LSAHHTLVFWLGEICLGLIDLNFIYFHNYVLLKVNQTGLKFIMECNFGQRLEFNLFQRKVGKIILVKMKIKKSMHLGF